MAKLWTKTTRWIRFQTISLFRVNDGSERVARGFAIGSVVNFFPTFGFGVVVSGFLAGLCRANVLSGFLGGGLFAALWPVLFYLNMHVGEFFFHSPVQVDDLDDVNEKTINALMLGKTFLAGAIANSLVAGVVLYALIFLIHSRSRARVLSWLSKTRKSKS